MELKDTLKHLANGELVMLPQNFYAEAFMVCDDEDGEEVLMSYSTKEQVIDYEIIGMILDNSSPKWLIKEDEFNTKTLEAFCEYFANDEEFIYEGPLKTNYICNKCGNQSIVIEENIEDYPFYCYKCDENMYSFETNKE